MFSHNFSCKGLLAFLRYKQWNLIRLVWIGGPESYASLGPEISTGPPAEMTGVLNSS